MLQQQIKRNKGEQKREEYKKRNDIQRSILNKIRKPITKPLSLHFSKVLVLNSSPKMEYGNTSIILNPFVTGMRGVGADVEVVHLYKLDINHCIGDFSCWTKTPGKCCQDDDMQILYPKIKNADIIVLATPIYYEMINSNMKNVIDRMIPLVEHYMISVFSGRTIHPLRRDVNHAKVVLVSTCGDWEMENFNPTIDYIKTFCNHMSYESHAGAISKMADFIDMKDIKDKKDNILNAARKAGEDLMVHDMMDQYTLGAISIELLSREEYIDVSRRYFEEQIVKNK